MHIQSSVYTLLRGLDMTKLSPSPRVLDCSTDRPIVLQSIPRSPLNALRVVIKSIRWRLAARLSRRNSSKATSVRLLIKSVNALGKAP
jgi:hypothetical protein